MVKKDLGKWRMCVDFTDLNKIGMSEEDQEKMTFFTDQGVYCYTTIPFGLKNGGATYQWLINRVFKAQIGRNVEAYVDDILLKSKETSAFLSDSAAKALPLFKVLKKADKFTWTMECQQAFEELKEYLHHLPTLTSSRPEETLYLYLLAADEAVSAVLMRDDGVQVPIYYISRVLCGPETRYTRAEKLVLGLVHVARRLKPYFLAHPAQDLTDFLAELTFLGSRDPPLTEAGPQRWTLYVDGSSNSGGSGAGLLLEDPHGKTCSYVLRFDFAASNNEAEYKSLIAGLQLARRLGAYQISVYSDSQLVVYQVQGEYEARAENMQQYLFKVHQLVAYFESFDIQRILRSKNRRADALSKFASTAFATLNKTVHVEVLFELGYLEEKVYPVTVEDTWMSLLINFFGQGVLPDDKAEARKIQGKAARYALQGGNLYKRSYLGPWLCCVTAEEGGNILRDIHEGLCEVHVGHRMLVKKALLLSYFWPTIRQDAQILVLSCPSCQHHTPEHHQPTNFMVPITSPWPFEQWGTDIIGPFPRATGGYAYIMVAIDYFTKWVETEALKSITDQAIQKFFWKHIVCRFGLSQIIIFDNGKQFVDNPFKAWCGELGIKQHFTSVEHPQTNGQAENFN
ncbi:uncharacterized protein LOC113751923 [Coffea eugenioides]|uniref:uncharacterized protein LOC113751923 n=1 Tax=Coffea eugenioides TaxID=49369 RepID=UPI000F609392|nr:uncharacterized protein LOC113751923 [Coffea eugenioides]